jgi:hypothetical protein
VRYGKENVVTVRYEEQQGYYTATNWKVAGSNPVEVIALWPWDRLNLQQK